MTTYVKTPNNKGCNLCHQSLMVWLKRLFDVLMTKHKAYSFCVIYFSHACILPNLLSPAKKPYKSHHPTGPWGCGSRAQQHMTSIPTGHLIGGRPWQASRVELAPDQPRRSFAPCGNQCHTPPNSRKQTTERKELCRSDLLQWHSHDSL